MTTFIYSREKFWGIICLSFFLFFPLISQAQNTWNGATNQFWDEATNWSLNIVPTNANGVIIPAGFAVIIENTAAVARRVEINAGASLSIVSGSLVIGSPPSLPFARMVLLDGGTLNISSGASLQVRRANIGINVIMGGTINNEGTITVGPFILNAGINVREGVMQLNNQSTGLITQMGNDFGFFIRIRSLGSGSVIDNFGTFDVNQNNVGNDFLFILASSTITNRQGGLIKVENSNEDVFNFEATGITFDNYGTIELTNGNNQGFDLDEGTITTNRSSGIIKITEMDDEAIDLEGTFTNDGIIEIINTDGPPEGSDEAIDLDDENAIFINRNIITIQNVEDDEAIDISGRFENEGIINVGLAASTASTFPAFLLEATGQLINTKCGVINITTPHLIENEGAVSNKGVITSVFTGNNINNGTFSNGGSIANIGGVFNVTGTRVGGTINSSPIPANSSPFCNPFIPTLSEWGLLIFMLLVLNLGLMGIKRKEALNLTI